MEKLLNNEYRNRTYFMLDFFFHSLKRHKYINSIFTLRQRWSSYCYLTKVEIDILKKEIIPTGNFKSINIYIFLFKQGHMLIKVKHI